MKTLAIIVDKLPESCAKCKYLNSAFCPVPIMGNFNIKKGRHADCNYVELPSDEEIKEQDNVIVFTQGQTDVFRAGKSAGFRFGVNWLKSKLNVK